MNLRVIVAQNQPKYEKHEIYEKFEKMYMNMKNNEKNDEISIFMKMKIEHTKMTGRHQGSFFLATRLTRRGYYLRSEISKSNTAALEG